MSGRLWDPRRNTPPPGTAGTAGPAGAWGGAAGGAAGGHDAASSRDSFPPPGKGGGGGGGSGGGGGGDYDAAADFPPVAPAAPPSASGAAAGAAGGVWGNRGAMGQVRSAPAKGQAQALAPSMASMLRQQRDSVLEVPCRAGGATACHSLPQLATPAARDARLRGWAAPRTPDERLGRLRPQRQLNR